MTGTDLEDLIFNLGRINGSILPLFNKSRLFIDKDKLLALGFHHK